MMKPRVFLLAFIYFVSSAALLVLNKIAISIIPNASALLLVQLASTVLILSVTSLFWGGAFRVNFRPTLQYVKSYTSVAAVFLTTIYSNFRLIHVVGVNSFIMLRCTTPLLVSLLDWFFLGRALPRGRSLLALFGIFGSGAAYTLTKLPDANLTGDLSMQVWIWSFTWLASFSLDMVYIKHVVDTYECTGMERTLYQNALALPFLAVVLVSPLESRGAVGSVTKATFPALTALLLSCLAGTLLSFTGMTLRSELSATLFTVLGILCKMASCLLNELFVEQEKNPLSLVCIFSAIVCSASYRPAPLRRTTDGVAAKISL